MSRNFRYKAYSAYYLNNKGFESKILVKGEGSSAEEVIFNLLQSIPEAHLGRLARDDMTISIYQYPVYQEEDLSSLMHMLEFDIQSILNNTLSDHSLVEGLVKKMASVGKKDIEQAVRKGQLIARVRVCVTVVLSDTPRWGEYSRNGLKGKFSYKVFDSDGKHKLVLSTRNFEDAVEAVISSERGWIACEMYPDSEGKR